MKFPVALQAYTIRFELEKDYLGALSQVASIGYQGIELGMPPANVSVSQLRAHLDHINLQAISFHVGLEKMKADAKAQLDVVQELGGAYIAMGRRFESRQDVLDCANDLNHIGEICRKRNIQLLYHNHDWEFVRFNGSYALDLLLQETDPELVQMQLDTYWVKRAGEEPAAYLQKLRNRCPLLHVKDMEPGPEQFFTEVGEGILDFDAILREADAAGTRWLVVEQDQWRRPAFESSAISYRNLQVMGVIGKR